MRVQRIPAVVLVVVTLSALVLGMQERGLEAIERCTLEPTDWADGDSFRVKCKNGDAFTIRLYGVDCIELHVHDDLDAQRLVTQRRYFGIPDIDTAKKIGVQAWRFTKAQLSRPFTVHTAYIDGRGDKRFKRYYGFVTTSSGEDLSSLLVRAGLARVHGTTRQTPDGTRRDEYGERLRDLELTAARRGVGAWSLTDWELLPGLRRTLRDVENELERAKDQKLTPGRHLNVNTATRVELMRVPGIGGVIASRIIENRPFVRVEDLLRVPGIGPKTLERVSPFLTVSPDR